ncbi:hypothetical protein DNTS_026776, partial [Danionella cerebrum]
QDVQDLLERHRAQNEAWLRARAEENDRERKELCRLREDVLQEQERLKEEQNTIQKRSEQLLSIMQQFKGIEIFTTVIARFLSQSLRMRTAPPCAANGALFGSGGGEGQSSAAFRAACAHQTLLIEHPRVAAGLLLHTPMNEDPIWEEPCPETSTRARACWCLCKYDEEKEFTQLEVQVELRKHKTSMGPAKAPSQPRRTIVGCRIQHIWKEGTNTGTPSQWKGTVLDQLHKDERVQGLQVLPDRLASTRISDAHLADTMIGKAVEHMFETEDGTKNEWRGMVLARAPIMNTWFYITYEKDPVLYMYQLLDDYKDGDLRIMPDSNDSPPAEREPGEVVDSLVGKQVEYSREDGSKRTGMVIHQVEAKPSVYFIKFDDDFHIYVYDLVKTS